MALLRRRQVLGGLALSAASCAPRPSPPALDPSRPRDADQIALDVVARRNPGTGARTWALFHVEVARGTAVTQASRTIFGVGYLLDAMRLDLEDHIASVFTASTGMSTFLHSCEAVHVFEHRLPPAAVRDAFRAALSRRRSEHQVSRDGVHYGHVRFDDVPRILAIPAPHLIVTMPESAHGELYRFTTSGGLPLARDGAAIRGEIIRPNYDVIGVDVPASLLGATVAIWLPSGDTRVEFAALSLDEQQATADAAWITSRVDEALTIDLAIAELKVLGPYQFVAAGRQVLSRIHLTSEETQWIVAMARKVQPGGD